MLKMKIGPQSLLKTKGQKKRSSEFAENKQVIVFYDELLKGEEIGRRGIHE
jgi:hypothetical protein